MSAKHITIPQIGPVSLYKRRGNRSIRLSITATGEVRVTLPAWAPYGAGEQFVRSRIEWINQHRTDSGPTTLQSGAKIGKAHRLHLSSDAMATKVSTRLLPNEVRVIYPLHLGTHDHPTVQEAARTASIRALRKEAMLLLPQRLSALALRTGLNFNTVQVKQLKSRWGSCSSRQEITLNLFLMQLPWQLIDYVLLHELTHTKFMEHGPAFWREFELHLPTARSLRREIRRYQPILQPGMV